VRIWIDEAVKDFTALLESAALLWQAELKWFEKSEAEQAVKGDLVVTWDLGLAAVCSFRGAMVLSPLGFWYYQSPQVKKNFSQNLFKEFSFEKLARTKI
jgi:uncharacterized protein YaiI (UPF0178 family)